MSEMALAALRWAARLSALLLAAIFVLFMLGEVLVPHSGPPTRFIEWFGIGLLTVGCLSPLLAWRFQLTGTLLSLTALILMLVVIDLDLLAPVAVAAIPGILYLADWLARRRWKGPGSLVATARE